MIVDRIIEAVQHQQFVAIFLEEVFVAHARFDVIGIGSESMISLCENVAFLYRRLISFTPLGSIRYVVSHPPEALKTT